MVELDQAVLPINITDSDKNTIVFMICAVQCTSKIPDVSEYIHIKAYMPMLTVTCKILCWYQWGWLHPTTFVTTRASYSLSDWPGI